MKLKIEYDLLLNQRQRELGIILDCAKFARAAIEREIIWLKLQEGPPSHLVEVDKQLTAIRKLCNTPYEEKIIRMGGGGE